MAKKKNKEVEYLYSVRKIKIKKGHQYFDLFKDLSHKANNLFNRTNYLVRKEFFNKKKFLTSAEITKLYKKNKEDVLFSRDYYSLPAQTAVVVTQKLEESWKSFFKLLDNSKTKPNARIPKYKKKGGQFTFTFTKQQIRGYEGKVCILPKLHKIKLDLEYSDEIQEIQVVPNKNHFVLNVGYREVKNIEKKKTGNYMCIDLGLNNLASIGFSHTSDTFIINGKGLKSKNLYFNYKIAQLQSHAMKRYKKYTTHQIKSLFDKRNRVMMDYIHKTTKKIVDLALEYDIDTVVVGHNINQKKKCKMKNFVQVPIFRIYEILRYKLEREGITLIEQQESFTSGTSVLDNELPNQECYDSSRRVSRGMFVSNNGIRVNADINGAYQTLKKFWVKNKNNRNIEFVGFNPVKFSV